MSKFGVPDNIQIPAMQKKAEQVYDLMVPGPGTPWEDAGSIGVFAAFFKTCWAAMVRPGKLLWQIRRPDTTKDASWFIVACGICWGISVAVHCGLLLWFHYLQDSALTVDVTQYWINTGIEAVLTAAGIWVLLKIGNNLYFKLTVLDSHSKATTILTLNVLAYTLGPSILAIIPFGPLLVLPWIFLLWIVMGVKRLKIKPGGAIIATCLVFLALAVIATGAYFAAYYFWNGVVGYGSLISNIAPSSSDSP